jgi:hypothetical protein
VKLGRLDMPYPDVVPCPGKSGPRHGRGWSSATTIARASRQALIKAGAKNSRHGGSLRTGGYGHGQAIDVTGTEGPTMDQVWRWLDGGVAGIDTLEDRLREATIAVHGQGALPLQFCRWVRV